MESGVPFMHARKRPGGQLDRYLRSFGVDKQKDSSCESLMVKKDEARSRSEIIIEDNIPHKKHLDR